MEGLLSTGPSPSSFKSFDITKIMLFGLGFEQFEFRHLHIVVMAEYCKTKRYLSSKHLPLVD